MSSSWYTTRSQMRRDIHDAFCTSATYEDDVVTVPKSITVRWQTKSERVGNINSGDYSEVLSTIDRLIFNTEEMAILGITLAHGGLIKLTEFGNYPFELDTKEPPDGPIKEEWTVTRP